MSQERVESLELDQDLKFQHREWAVQRAGWLVMALVVIAALLGLFATGPLSGTSATTNDEALRIEYGRFARHEAHSTLHLEISPQAVQNGQVQVHVNQAFVDTWEIESITPEPESSTLEADGITWSFTTGELTDAVRVLIRIRPDDIGIGRGEISLVGGVPLSFRQIIYP